ncbi:RYamide receptor-like [Haliotis cracherodii]|uniref:RYamide receptor-like n=1 Tax=Haliotis rufescens TaxID=6454 RepID=UPI001EB03599|nr:RYamide receptor-like [Haliotis rufescens]
MNDTDLQDQFPWKISEYMEIILIIMYSIITITAIGGNGVVCYLVFAYKRMHTVPNYFIVNLAVSDLLLAVFCIPFTAAVNLKNYWPFPAVMCPVLQYIQGVTVVLSSYTLVAMSLDRYIVIVHPFLKRITPRKTVFVITAIWTVSLAIPLPIFLNSKLVYYSNTSGQCFEVWEDHSKKYTYSVALMVLQYFGPLVILIFSYSKIGYNIWVKNFKSDEGNKRRLQLAAAKKKMIRMMITVVVFYALCWLPIHVITILGDHDFLIYDHPYMPIIWLLCHWLAMSNSCYNPIIYIWMSPKFRTGLLMAFNRCSRRRPSNSESDEFIVRKERKEKDREPERESMCYLMEVHVNRKQHDVRLTIRNGHCGLPVQMYLGRECNCQNEVNTSIHSDT